MATVEVTEDGLVISGEGAPDVQKRIGWMQDAVADRDQVIRQTEENAAAVIAELEAEIRTCYAQIKRLEADVSVLQTKAGDWAIKKIRRTVRDADGLIISIIDEERQEEVGS